MRVNRLKDEARWSAKWTAISILPAVVVLFLSAGMLGGIEGNGKLILIFSFAPVIFAKKLLATWGLLTWPIIVIFELTYYFGIILGLRLFFSSGIVRSVVGRIACHFRPRRPRG